MTVGRVKTCYIAASIIVTLQRQVYVFTSKLNKLLEWGKAIHMEASMSFLKVVPPEKELELILKVSLDYLLDTSSNQ